MDDPLPRKYTPKQMGDACEMLVAAELTLAGTPAMKAPDNWPHYDVIAQPHDSKNPTRISVKSRTYKKGAAFVIYNEYDEFDWLAIVILDCPPDKNREIYIVPRHIADKTAKRDSPQAKTAHQRYWRIDEIAKVFPTYINNFTLQT
jgi:hypothetical protein